MITVNSNSEIVVNLRTDTYNLSKASEFSDLMLVLTDPLPNEKLTKDEFCADASLDEGPRAIAERYSEFFAEYLCERDAILAEKSKELYDAGQQLEELVASLEKRQ